MSTKVCNACRCDDGKVCHSWRRWAWSPDGRHRLMRHCEAAFGTYRCPFKSTDDGQLSWTGGVPKLVSVHQALPPLLSGHGAIDTSDPPAPFPH